MSDFRNPLNLLEAARHADDPPVGARTRGWAQLERSIAAGQAAPGLSASPPVSAPAWALHAKLAVAGLVAMMAAFGVAAALGGESPGELAASAEVEEPQWSETDGSSRYAPVFPDSLRSAPPPIVPAAPVTREPMAHRKSSARPPRPRAASGPAPAAPTTEAPAVPDALAAELALMGEVRSAMRAGAHARAERLLARHARSFADGLFADEREFSRITVACRQGAVQRANRIANEYEAAHPGSSKARRRLADCDGPK